MFVYMLWRGLTIEFGRASDLITWLAEYACQILLFVGYLHRSLLYEGGFHDILSPSFY